YRIGIRRKLAERQLRDVFPNLSTTEQKRIIRNVYKIMALNAVDVFLTKDSVLFANSTFENSDYIKEALDRNKGVLLITGHFGNWEAPCRVLPMAGYGLAMITKKQRNTLFDDYTNAIRERQGATIIDMKSALKGVLKHTSHNDLIGILIDQNAGKKGVLVDFLGKPASNWKGTAKIALKYQIPIVPGFVIRSNDGSLIFRFEKMIDPAGLADNDENMLLVIKMMNQALEKKIKQYPEQWFWLHKRWKGARYLTQPQS
ncbi:MAG: lysophospholipid acyltransferase family protein, partial [Candidatus Cloacimonetes bacterium]|nr:lysophospholipid acyltransferase family protein [Candidatus Cloacimonadota bacterium]